MFHLDHYDYHLPEELIAQAPVAHRDRSRLLSLRRDNGAISHQHFTDLDEFLRSGDVLVLNNTRVIPGRLLGRKESGGKVEVLILDYAQGIAKNRFECMVRASKRPKPGTYLIFDHGLKARVEGVNATTSELSFNRPGDFEQVLDTIGHMPLPPYIRRSDNLQDVQNYQTVYARHKGAIAAPTAGLHFTADLLEQLSALGVKIVYLTLHVGYGTFVPVRVDDIREHRMHAEWFELSRSAAQTINTAKQTNGRIVAVGTTCMRTLEFCAADNNEVLAQRGMCDLFIYPGYRFKAVDAMVTNFHLPQSTLLMLVSAFAGRTHILDAYAEAIREKYRFYSYGDAMMIY